MKAFQRPMHGRLWCDAVCLGRNKSRTWVSTFPSLSILPWKKSNLVLSKAKAKASVMSFCFILKLSPWELTQSAADPVPATARPTGLHALGEKECANVWGEWQVRSPSKKSVCVCVCVFFFFSLGILLAWVWDGPSALLFIYSLSLCILTQGQFLSHCSLEREEGREKH